MSPAAQTTPLVAALEELGPHDHLCSIYENQPEHFAVAMPFIRIGLDRGEKCLYIADDGTEDVVRDAMAAEGIDVERSVAMGALAVAGKEDAYLREGVFNPEWMFTFWKEATAKALDEGFSALRATGETEWVLRGAPGMQRWMEHESRLTRVLADNRCLALCQYNRNLFPPELILDVIRTHPTVAYRGTLCKNMYFVPPEECLATNQAAREVERLLTSIRDREEIEYAMRRQRDDLQNSEQRLRRSEAYLVEGQRISHTGSWAWTVSSGDLFWSAQHFRILGLDPDMVAPTSQMFFDRIHPDDRALTHAAFQRAVRDRSDFDHDYRIVRPDGTVRHIHSLAHPVFHPSGDVTEYVGTVIDVTDRKLADDALRTMQAELARAARATTMGQLTGSIAHEVNQPLAAVVANGSACLRWLAGATPNLEEAREALVRIIRDANRASEVIARIRALFEKTTSERERVDLNQSIQAVLTLARGELHKNGVTLRAELAEGLPPVLGDRVQLQQVVLNLIMNAIEAMAGRDAPPELVIASEKHDAGRVRVTVRDSGPGLDPESLTRVFEAFYTTKPQGMGIGLSISHTIIAAHGGRLWGARNSGSGMTFQFTLPVFEGEGDRFIDGERFVDGDRLIDGDRL
jgi:PAS domain S-box-containing protein